MSAAVPAPRAAGVASALRIVVDPLQPEAVAAAIPS
jgi:hypothetical protein